ncbi:MAG: hypothetical protein RIC19_03115 [Phaeodactylibacter sp.]|uniref:hypothetical protein n=1 Tax=Phaeodactylibacter sp. TaxID=1940289 RepID=UPI0032ED1D6D
MQDNNTPEVNPEWVEEGWSGMSQLLDQEMPVPNRRPVARPWWAAALLMVVLSIGFLWLQGIGATMQAVGQLPVPVKGGAAPTLASSGAVAPPAADQRTLRPAAAEALAPQQQAVPPPPADLMPTQTATVQTPPSPAQFATQSTAVEQPRDEPGTTAVAASGNTKAQPPANALTDLSPARILATPYPTLLKAKQHPADFSATLRSHPTATRSRWGVGLLLSGLYGPEQPTAGFEAGTFLSWQAPGIKWYGRLQLSYLQIAANQQVDERQFAASVRPMAAAPAPATLVTFSAAVETLHLAGMALYTGYQVTPRLGLEGGLFSAYLVNARQKNSWAENLETNSGGGTDGSQADRTALNSTRHFTSATGLARWNTGWAAGIRYRINGNLATTLRYQAPFGNFLEATNPTSINNNISLSLFRHF